MLDSITVMCPTPVPVSLAHALESPTSSIARLSPTVHRYPFHLLHHHHHHHQPQQIVIQLVEGPPGPLPPKSIAAAAAAAPLASSSSSTLASDSDEENEDEDENHSLGLMSDYVSHDGDVNDGEEDTDEELLSETDHGRMVRVCAWREMFAKEWDVSLADSSRSSSLKRKMNESLIDHMDTDDAASKRWRHPGSPLLSHSCPACDAAFPSRHDLRLHGCEPAASEPCRIAVAYSLE